MSAEEIKRRDLYVIIETLRKNGLSGTKIESVITTAWGEIISLRRIQDIMKEFKSGERNTFDRDLGSGRPMSDKRLNLVDTIRQEIIDNPHISCRDLATLHDTSYCMIHNIVSNDLGMKSVSDRFVPHTLTMDNKAERVRCCKEIIKAFRTRNIETNLCVTDEKWFYSRPIGSPSTRTSWVSPDGDGAVRRPQIAKRMTTEKKYMAIIGTNFSGLSYSKVLLTGVTVDSHVYMEFLTEMMDSFNTYELQIARKAVCWRNATIFHDNARPHTSNATRTFITGKNCTLLKQPPYSPDINICDRMVFPKLEMERRHITFNSADEVQEFLTDHLRNNNADIMSRQLIALGTHCQKVIDKNGDYI